MKNRRLAIAVLFGLAGLWAIGRPVPPERNSPGHAVASQSLAGMGPWAGGQSPALRSTDVADVPLAFVQNRGQWDFAARFVARALDMVAYLEPGAIVLRRLSPEEGRGHVVRLEFEGTSPEHTLESERPLPGEHHFLRGNDRSRWRTHVPSYASVLYRELYEGIEVQLHERRQRRRCLEYDVLLAPFADVSQLVVRCEGITGPLRVNEQGVLELPTSLGVLRQTPPVAWQPLPSGERRSLACFYQLLGSDRFGFGLERRDSSLPVVIDPGLEWSTFLGGTLNEVLQDMTVDATGAVTFVGDTQSLDLPVSSGAFDTTYDPHIFGGPAGFVSRLDANGQLLFSTFLEGSVVDLPCAVAVAANGDTLVGGLTSSPDFPITAGAFDIVKDGAGDAFITRLTSDGSDLVFSTFLGGAASGLEIVHQLALTTRGDVIAALRVDTADFPTTPGAFDTTHNSPGGPDVAVVCLDATGSTLLFSTFLGGSSNDTLRDLAMGPTDEILVVGGTSSLDFPTTPGAFSVHFPGPFVTCLTADGSGLVFSTGCGGTNGDSAWVAAFGPLGNIYVAGETNSTNLPTTPGAFQPAKGGSSGPDGFLTCFDPMGTHLIYSTYLGGVRTDVVEALLIDSAGAALLAGSTASFNFPVTAGAFDTSLNLTGGKGTWDAFVSVLSPDGSRLDYSTFLGGSLPDAGAFGGHVGLGRLDDGSVIMGTTTAGAGYPTTSGAFQETFAGAIDLAMTRLDMLPTGVTRYGASTPGCQGPLVMSITAFPKADGSTTITCRDAPPFSSRGLLLVSQAPLTTPLTVSGAQLWVDPTRLVSAIPVNSNTLGFSEFRVRVPDASGVTGYCQFVWLDPCAPGGWSASNALEVVIQ